jgi:hypothetical protein
MNKMKKVRKKRSKPLSKSDIIKDWPEHKKAGTNSYGYPSTPAYIEAKKKEILKKRTCVSLFSCSEISLKGKEVFKGIKND